MAVIALLLTGCQSPPQTVAEQHGCDPTTSGSASDGVTAGGKVFEVPRVRFAAPLDLGRTERTVLKAGNGRTAEDGALVTFAYTAYDGSSGDLIDTVGYETPHVQALLDESTMLAGLRNALLCSTEGSRVAAVIPPSDAFGEAGSEQYGIGAGDSIVVVIDVVAVAADRADGEPQEVMDSLPRADVGATGEPEITIPAHTPPSAYSATVLKRGDGEVVTEGSTVTVEYRGVVWASGRTFDSTWRRDDVVQLPTTSFVEGFGDALIGQPVGSQVMAIVPPSLGYGPGGNVEFGISSTDTLVFVIDILAVVQPPAATAPEE